MLALCLIAFTGCASQTSRQTEVRGNTIINKSTGFNGWSVEFPDNYTRASMEVLGVSYYDARVVASFARSIDRGPGQHASEHYVYESNYSAIAVSTVQISRMYDSTHVTRLIDDLLRGFKFPSGTEVERKMLVVNGRKVAKISRLMVDAKKYNSVYQIPIPPGHVIAINSYCDLSAKERVDADIEGMIAGMVDGTN